MVPSSLSLSQIFLAKTYNVFCEFWNTSREAAMDAPPNCQVADLRRGETSPFLDQEVTSSRPGEDQKEVSSREWTNEKHSLYLNSMEASFVNECLYESSELLGWPPRPRKRNPSVTPPSGQFKAVRGGLWRKMKFARGENQNQNQDERRQDEIQSNPWIKHFRSSRRGRVAGSVFIPENISAATFVSKRGQQTVSFTTSTQSPPRNPLDYHHSVGSSTINIEVSDQNFVEDEMEENRKGMKTADRLMGEN